MGPTLPATEPRDRTEALSSRQWIAVLAPIILIAAMFPVFAVADRVVGDAAGGYLGWFIGLSVYWVLCGLLSVGLIGTNDLRRLIRPRRPADQALALVGFLLVMAALVRLFVPGIAYDKPSIGVVVLLASSALGNGLFEETWWRGVYLRLFADRTALRVWWPSLCFALWHLAPGSIFAEGPQAAMVVGPFFMGLFQAFLARRTDGVWWPIVAHTLGGLIMVS